MTEPYLYHYCKINEHALSLLANSRFYFSAPKEINDPFDSKGIFLNQGVLSDYKEHCWMGWKKSNPLLSDEEAEKKWEQIESWLASDPQNKEAVFNDFRRTTMEVFEQLRFFCLCKKPNNILMWSHYADKHSGMCLKFDRRLLIASLDGISIEDIHYGLPTFSDLIDVIRSGGNIGRHLATSKANQWEYEAEVRLVAERKQGNSLAGLDETGRFHSFNPRALTGVIFGCKTEGSCKLTVFNIFKNREYQPKFYVASACKDRYELTFGDYIKESPITSRSIIRTVNVETGKEFWELLSNESQLLSHDTPEQFLYRGHGDSEWKLVPSLYREPTLKKMKFFLYPTSKSQIDDITFFEISILKQFLDYCDKTGLRIPGDSAELRRLLGVTMSGELEQCLRDPKRQMPAECQSIMALAQHHGLPTRLLDWSSRSQVAAYFAASDAIRNYVKSDNKETQNKRLVVWRLDTSKLNLLPNLDTVAVSSDYNNNLRAQAGKFVTYHPYLVRDSLVDNEPPAIDNYVESRAVQEVLMKITLPISEAPILMDLCHRTGISASTMFPDYYGAVRHIDDDLAIQEFKAGAGNYAD